MIISSNVKQLVPKISLNLVKKVSTFWQRHQRLYQDNKDNSQKEERERENGKTLRDMREIKIEREIERDKTGFRPVS